MKPTCMIAKLASSLHPASHTAPWDTIFLRSNASFRDVTLGVTCAPHLARRHDPDRHGQDVAANCDYLQGKLGALVV